MSTTESKPQAAQPAKPTAPKSYTERFMDMESMVNKIAYVVNFQGQLLTSMMQEMERAKQDLLTADVVRKTVNAVIKVSEAGNQITLENVAKKMVQVEQAAMREQLNKDLSESKLLPVQEVSGKNEILEFIADAAEGPVLSALKVFPKNAQEALKGKKAGDIVEYEVTADVKAKIEVVAIYAYPQQPEQGGNDEQAAAEAGQ